VSSPTGAAFVASPEVMAAQLALMKEKSALGASRGASGNGTAGSVTRGRKRGDTPSVLTPVGGASASISTASSTVKGVPNQAPQKPIAAANQVVPVTALPAPASTSAPGREGRDEAGRADSLIYVTAVGLGAPDIVDPAPTTHVMQTRDGNMVTGADTAAGTTELERWKQQSDAIILPLPRQVVPQLQPIVSDTD
jgi:hypothetical protein